MTDWVNSDIGSPKDYIYIHIDRGYISSSALEVNFSMYTNLKSTNNCIH